MLGLISLLALVALLACQRRAQPELQLLQTETKTRPDYTNADHWAAHPRKKDPSDSVPFPLRKELRDTLVDVFFLHPTTYTDQRRYWNAELGDAALNSKTDLSTILFQATVFNQHARIFAPRYRQAHLSAFYSDEKPARDAFDTAYADLKKAFEHFLKNDHADRPLIIAGHSQGALMAIRLLKDYFDGKPLQEKLVAAYIVGWPVTRNSFDALKICADSLQTGCFCSWRTFRVDYLPDYIAKEETAALVTNPLSWTTTEDFVSREKNKGSILRDFNKLVPATTDARVHGGVLWVNRPRFPGSIFFNTRNYHIGDINLFYMNIRHNVQQRIEAWMKKQ